jgi:hypothetical protein
MFDTHKTKLPGAMGFYHEKGFVPAFKQASKYAGKKGHIATIPDWVDARLGTGPYKDFGYHDPSNPTPWDMYYTTMSAEYVGYSKGGRKILIVAHGIGPMATLDGCLAAYRWEYDDPRNKNGARISADEFLKLESGVYGKVEIVDLEMYIRSMKYPFIEHLRASQALCDPVLKARLGPKAVQYIKCHTAYAMQYHAEVHKRKITDPYILEVRGPGEYWVEHHKIEDGLAYAHLLSVGAVMLSHHQSEYDVPSWMSDTHTHDWSDGTRLIGVREGSITGVGKGPDPYRLLRSNWKQLMEPSGIKAPFPGAFHVLTQLTDETWFTQVDKMGDGMDNGEPEFLVTSIKPIGEPVQFFTDVRHYHGFFKYAKSEVRAVMPPGANAYALVGDPENVWEGGNPVKQTCMAQPYRVEIDHTRRLVREKTLANNYERMMELMKAA